MCNNCLVISGHPTLFTIGYSDTRVDPMHAKKMAAEMQAEAKNGTSRTRPILLRIETKAATAPDNPTPNRVKSSRIFIHFCFGN